MNESSGGTREQILLAAKAEFLEKGFQHASLRNIVKTAGVTTGALYGYYDSKEALFDALVREGYEYAMGRFKEALSTFAALPIERQPESLGQVSGDCMQEMLLYMHEHRDTFHLLLLHSDGTRYATMVDELVALEVDATHRYYTVLAQLGAPMPHVDEALEQAAPAETRPRRDHKRAVLFGGELLATLSVVGTMALLMVRILAM